MPDSCIFLLRVSKLTVQLSVFHPKILLSWLGCNIAACLPFSTLGSSARQRPKNQWRGCLIILSIISHTARGTFRRQAKGGWDIQLYSHCFLNSNLVHWTKSKLRKTSVQKSQWSSKRCGLGVGRPFLVKKWLLNITSISGIQI